MLATVVVPIILAIKMSLYADVLYKPQDYRFIGLGNYVRLVRGPGVLADAVEFRGLGVRLGHRAIHLRICRRLLLQQAFRGARWCARSRCCPGSSRGRGGTDLGVALSTELRRHQ
jgi:ABC-type sugar transport systems, permease components